VLHWYPYLVESKTTLRYFPHIIEKQKVPAIAMGWTPDFEQRAKNGDLTVGIIGLGYVGLPTAIGFHDAGFNVWGVDI
jgi:phosphoglycerate dehydrogenase-like enzyme